MSENHSELALPFVDAKHALNVVSCAVRASGADRLHAMCCSNADLPRCLAESRCETLRAQFSRIAPTVLLRRRRHKRRRHRLCNGTRLQGSSCHPCRSRRAVEQLKQRPFVLNSSGESILVFVHNDGLNYSAPLAFPELAFQELSQHDLEGKLRKRIGQSHAKIPE